MQYALERLLLNIDIIIFMYAISFLMSVHTFKYNLSYQIKLSGR